MRIVDDFGSVERYSIAGNNWECLPDMADGLSDCCTVARLGSDIYVLQNFYHSLKAFDTESLE